MMKSSFLLFIFLIFNTHLAKADPITEEEKNDVVAYVTNYIANESAFISQELILQDPQRLAYELHCQWHNSCGDFKTTFNSNFLKQLEAAKNSLSREEFRKEFSQLLEYYSSHFSLNRAGVQLYKTLLSTSLGQAWEFQFEPIEEDESYIKFRITDHKQAKNLSNSLIETGKTFYLPNHKEDLKECGGCTSYLDTSERDEKIPDSIFIKEIITIQLFRDEVKAGLLRVTSDKKELKTKNESILEVPTSWIEETNNLDFKNCDKNPITISFDMCSELNRTKVTYTIRAMIRESAPLMILDLRGNSGGNASVAKDILSYFVNGDIIDSYAIDRKVISEFAKRNSELWTNDSPYDQRIKILTTFIKSEYPGYISWVKGKQDIFQGKLVLFVNEKTGSAAEILAGNLRYYLGSDRSVIIGTKTAGEVACSFSGSFRLIQNFHLVTPDNALIMPDGTFRDGIGFFPDKGFEVLNDSNANDYLRLAGKWYNSIVNK